MAVLIRNLFIFFLFTVLLALSYGIWKIEHRLRTVTYSEFRYCLTNHDLAAITFIGNKVIAEHQAGDRYETTVPNAEKLISELQEKNIQIIFKKDRSEQIFQGLALLYIILLVLTVIISLSKKKRLEEDQMDRTTLSFYQYANLGNPELFRNHLSNKLLLIRFQNHYVHSRNTPYFA